MKRKNKPVVMILAMLAVVVASLIGQASRVEASTSCSTIVWYGFTSGSIQSNPLSTSSLQYAVNNNTCVGMDNAANPAATGTLYLAYTLNVPPGHTLLGAQGTGSNLITLEVAPNFLSYFTGTHPNPSMIGVGSVGSTQEAVIEDFNIDGNNMGASGGAHNWNGGTFTAVLQDYATLTDITITHARCAAIALIGYHDKVTDGIISNNGLPTGSSYQDSYCGDPNNPGSLVEQEEYARAGIYMQGPQDSGVSRDLNLVPVIRNNYMQNNTGPAIDNNAAGGGILDSNHIDHNGQWTEVSMYGASNWAIKANSIYHYADGPNDREPWTATIINGGHPTCVNHIYPYGTQPHTSALLFCQDSSILGQDASHQYPYNNYIYNNNIAGPYSIVLTGTTTYLPRGFYLTNNNVYGSVNGTCFDGATSSNVWYIANPPGVFVGLTGDTIGGNTTTGHGCISTDPISHLTTVVGPISIP